MTALIWATLISAAVGSMAILLSAALDGIGRALEHFSDLRTTRKYNKR